MHVQVSGHHLEITPALHEYVIKRLERFDHHFKINKIEVILSSDKEKIGKKAEANLHYAGHDLNATALSEDLYAAIDSMADKLHRQAVKQKEKLEGE